jgi:flavin reductase (DIM6/NTAB) family NADH-FMN oxidoreductase RutF
LPNACASARKQQVARPAIADQAHSDRTALALGRIIGSLCVVTTQADGIHTGLLTAWVAQASFSPPGLMLALPRDVLTRVSSLLALALC